MVGQIVPGFIWLEGGLGWRNYSGMGDETSSTPAGVPASSPLNPADFFFALGSDVRWAIFKLLADGKPRRATDVAAVLKRDFDGVSKHLRLMREAGAVSVVVGEDRRYVWFAIPSKYRREAGVVDFGICKICLSPTNEAVAKD